MLYMIVNLHEWCSLEESLYTNAYAYGAVAQSEQRQCIQAVRVQARRRET